MQGYRGIRGLVMLALSVASLFVPAHGALHRLDFEGLPFQLYSYNNFDYRGFRFSPGCTVLRNGLDPWNGPPQQHGDFLAPFITGCDDDGNPNFLGPDQYRPPQSEFGTLYVDRPGEHFSLVSLLMEFWTGVVSSRGGYFFYELVEEGQVPVPINLSGELWTDLDWIVILGGTGEPRGIDDLVLRIPEPSSIALFAAGALVLVSAIRRRRT